MFNVGDIVKVWIRNQQVYGYITSIMDNRAIVCPLDDKLPTYKYFLYSLEMVS